MIGEVIGGRYELDELVGSGGMSSVYRARDTLLERDVALKILHEHYTADDEYVERFRREARAVAQLSHPNIVTVIDRGEEEGRQFIVFEYVDGKTLKECLEKDGPMAVRRALELAIQVARGLAFAHDNGLVHRDVKPQNVILNGDGQAKVTDFGIARSLEVQGVTRSGTVLGTSSYIAPEQASGGDVEPATDVYSLGVVLFELLTGHVPFTGESFVSVAMQHVTEPPPSVLDLRPDVPVRLANAVDRALAKDPADRYASMHDFASELEACLAALGTEPGEDATLIQPPVVLRESRPWVARSPRRWPLALVAVGLLLLLAAIAGAFWALRGSDRPLTAGGGSGGSAAPAKLSPVKLTAAGSYDPQGDGAEHTSSVSKAVDGDPGTYWDTEHYRDLKLEKPGVGFVLDAGGSKTLRRVVLATDTPGLHVQIRGGDSAQGPFPDALSSTRTIESSTTIPLQPKAVRYVLVWITQLPPGSDTAHVNEVKAFS
ncbi:MAG TPA: protein kinase [Gaiellaceae bacterium]